MTPDSTAGRLVAVLRRAAEAGQPCPSNTELAEQLDLHVGNVSDVLRNARLLGLVRLEAVGGNRRVAVAGDGSWRTAPTALGIRREAPVEVAERRCLRCRGPFQPAHRHNFLCTHCRVANAGGEAA